MAAVTPTPANRCKGIYADGTANRRLYCLKTAADDGNVMACVTMKYFKVTCSKVNVQCNSLSGAYVAAVTCCAQKLY